MQIGDLYASDSTHVLYLVVPPSLLVCAMEHQWAVPFIADHARGWHGKQMQMDSCSNLLYSSQVNCLQPKSSCKRHLKAFLSLLAARQSLVIAQPSKLAMQC